MSNNQQYTIINFSIIYCAFINKISCFVIIFSHDIFLIFLSYTSLYEKKCTKQISYKQMSSRPNKTSS